MAARTRPPDPLLAELRAAALIASGGARDGLRTLRERGTGATLHRRVFEGHGALEAVITAAGTT